MSHFGLLIPNGKEYPHHQNLFNKCCIQTFGRSNTRWTKNLFKNFDTFDTVKWNTHRISVVFFSLFFYPDTKLRTIGTVYVQHTRARYSLHKTVYAVVLEAYVLPVFILRLINSLWKWRTKESSLFALDFSLVFLIQKNVLQKQIVGMIYSARAWWVKNHIKNTNESKCVKHVLSTLPADDLLKV